MEGVSGAMRALTGSTRSASVNSAVSFLTTVTLYSTEMHRVQQGRENCMCRVTCLVTSGKLFGSPDSAMKVFELLIELVCADMKPNAPVDTVVSINMHNTRGLLLNFQCANLKPGKKNMK